MLNAFENISAPNEKLRLVNDLSRGVARIDQMQRAHLLDNANKNYGFNNTRDLILKIDTLQSFYTQNPKQEKRLNSLKKLLQDRDRLFINYLKVRKGLIDNKSFSAQVESLDEIVDESARQADSMATSTEKTTSTTTVFSGIETAEKKEKRGFFNRLFGRKKAKDTDSLSRPFQIVAEESKVKHDTLAKAIQDSLLQGLSQTMRELERVQQEKSARFVNRETILIKSSSNIMRQIFSILKKVEIEVVGQTAANNAAARNIVHSSIKRISLIILGFVILIILLVYFILTDISRINKYRKELEEAKDEAEYHAHAKQRFLSNMSHEIRTPLQSIIGYAEMIREQDRPQKKDIEAIYRSSGHLMQIVNEILDYNRIISGKFSFTYQNFEMLSLLNETVSVMLLQAENKGIDLLTDFDGIVNQTVTGDPFRLKQILYNLIGNAIKFTSQGGVTLTVNGKQAGNFISFTFKVSDTGIGLTADETERIFNEFERAGDESRIVGGTGLGLPITKELIESQGGEISVKSQPDQGSTFSFHLKFKKAPVEVNDKERQPKASLIVSIGRVWVVDDDPFILELCARILESNKIVYRCFNSPKEMLGADWDDAVKNILLDIRMPEMSGIDLCDQLRKKIPGNVRIYALTAQALPGEQERIAAQGFNGLLMKPFRENELLKLLGKNIAAGTEAPVFDIRSIEKMTFGDPEQTSKILATFAKENRADAKAIRLALTGKNIEKLRLILHRVAGRAAQAGARGLARDFRRAETGLSEKNKLPQETEKEILKLTDQLDELSVFMKRYPVDEAAI